MTSGYLFVYSFLYAKRFRATQTRKLYLMLEHIMHDIDAILAMTRDVVARDAVDSELRSMLQRAIVELTSAAAYASNYDQIAELNEDLVDRRMRAAFAAIEATR